jgi:hypothetical protein
MNLLIEPQRSFISLLTRFQIFFVYLYYFYFYSLPYNESNLQKKKLGFPFQVYLFVWPTLITF